MKGAVKIDEFEALIALEVPEIGRPNAGQAPYLAPPSHPDVRFAVSQDGREAPARHLRKYGHHLIANAGSPGTPLVQLLPNRYARSPHCIPRGEPACANPRQALSTHWPPFSKS